MNRSELETTAKAMVAKGKGILAADESSGTIKKRFDTIKLESTEEARRTYRELLFTAPSIAGPALRELSTRLGLPLHRIGQITGQTGDCLLRESDGILAPASASGYDHFA